MALRIYNSLGRKKEAFIPLESGKVKMYVCGPTVYDSSHIGHARSVTVFDVVFRYLKSIGYAVTYVRNFTDVDDKIINRANEQGKPPAEIAEKYILEFTRDMKALNVEAPTMEPKATEHIDTIIRVIETLIQKKNAYVVDGDVFFSVESFPEYGRLSGRKLEDMEAGRRVEVDLRKRNPFDFALWKSAKPGEPSWASPWGDVRPGWHIECTAMGSRYLGQTFDIHGGGKDLIFPHHENEIAQSEAAFGKTFVKYWMHNGFVNINHEKMSKSLGNFLMIKDVLKKYHPEAVRLFLLSKQYRNPIDFTDDAINDAGNGLDKIYTVLERIDKQTEIQTAVNTGPLGKLRFSSNYWRRFVEAMDDDFNTAKGIGTLFETVREINRELDLVADETENGDLNSIIALKTDLLRMGTVLGILQRSPAVYLDEKKALASGQGEFDPQRIEELVAQREAARNNKDWETADRIRHQLDQLNVILEDRADGTVWKIASK